MFGWLEWMFDFNKGRHGPTSRKGHRGRMARDKARRKKHQKRYAYRTKRRRR